MPKQKAELKQYEEYCQEYYNELNSEPQLEPEVDSQSKVLSI